MKMLPPQVVIPHRRPGRPALAEGQRSTPVSVRFCNADYDRLDAEARRQGVTLPELIRQKIIVLVL